MQTQRENPDHDLQLQEESNEEGLEDWGDGSVVYHDSEGVWIMYDPESDVVDRDDWR